MMGPMEHNPMTGRALPIAETCIFALGMMLTVPNPTGLENSVLIVGLISASIFWLQCYFISEVES